MWNQSTEAPTLAGDSLLYPPLVIEPDLDIVRARRRLERFFNLFVTHLSYRDSLAHVRLALRDAIREIAEFDGKVTILWRRPVSEIERVAAGLSWAQCGRIAGDVNHVFPAERARL
jgi:hypothetical protein